MLILKWKLIFEVSKNETDFFNIKFIINLIHNINI
jgi:hypothetical protein